MIKVLQYWWLEGPGWWLLGVKNKHIYSNIAAFWMISQHYQEVCITTAQQIPSSNEAGITNHFPTKKTMQFVNNLVVTFVVRLTSDVAMTSGC